MSLQGIPGMSTATRSFINMVRAFLRDQPELNRLTDGEESNDRQIAWAIMDALSRFNGTPPLLGNSGLEGLLAANQHYLLLRMTVCALLESVALLQIRNRLSYTTGGMTVAINDKGQELLNVIQFYRNITDQELLRVKIAMNISQMLDGSASGIFSEFWSVNATYAAY